MRQIALADPAVCAAAGECRQVDAAVVGQPPRPRRGHDPSPGRRRSGRSGEGRGHHVEVRQPASGQHGRDPCQVDAQLPRQPPHRRGVHWRAGADWFLEHLLDGYPASNHLSWQWVAGTFSAKPYLFNRENLESYTAGIHCRTCPLLGRCDVEGTYDDLAARLFTAAGPAVSRPALRIPPAAASISDPATAARPLVWLTLDSAAETSPAAARFPEAPRLFVVDPSWLDAERPSRQRLAFLFECLAPVEPGISAGKG